MAGRDSRVQCCAQDFFFFNIVWKDPKVTPTHLPSPVSNGRVFLFFLLKCFKIVSLNTAFNFKFLPCSQCADLPVVFNQYLTTQGDFSLINTLFYVLPTFSRFSSFSPSAVPHLQLSEQMGDLEKTSFKFDICFSKCRQFIVIFTLCICQKYDNCTDIFVLIDLCRFPGGCVVGFIFRQL